MEDGPPDQVRSPAYIRGSHGARRGGKHLSGQSVARFPSVYRVAASCVGAQMHGARSSAD